MGPFSARVSIYPNCAVALSMARQRIAAGCPRVSASRAADHPARGAGTGMVTTVTVTIPVAIEVVGPLPAARAPIPEKAVTI